MYKNMEREQSAKNGEIKLNPQARVWVGMKQIDPGEAFDGCSMIPTPGAYDQMNIIFRGSDSVEVTVENIDDSTPVMTEHLVPFSAPACLDTRVCGYNLQDESIWLNNYKPDTPTELDKPYFDLKP